MNKLPVSVILLILLTVMSCIHTRYMPEVTSSDLQTHIDFLASDELRGRFPGTEGDVQAGKYIEKYFTSIGLESGSQEFFFTKAVQRGPLTSLTINGKIMSDNEYSPFAFSADTFAEGRVVYCGYGITVKADSFEWDDYKGMDVKGKWILALRGTPSSPGAAQYLELVSDDRDKAMLAADNGAVGIILVSPGDLDQEDRIVKVDRNIARVGIPAFHVSRRIADMLMNGPGLCNDALINARSHIQEVRGLTHNIYAELKGSDPVLNKEYIIIGAHFDHLGIGGSGSSSRRQDTFAVHNGADDNASGVAMMLEIAGKLKERQSQLKRSCIFAAFGAEEMGLLGSKHFVNHLPVDISTVTAMINLDMVGRLDTSRGIQVGGTGTSLEAESLIKLSESKGLKLRLNPEGSGPSDHSSFYGKNIPVFFITTGAHTDYHTPDDDSDRINYEGMVTVADFTDKLLNAIDVNPLKLSFREAGPKESTAGPGYRFKVTLGFMPDFSSTDVEGVRVDFVTKGKAAERGGIKNGDVITAIDGLPVKNIYDYMYRLGKLSRNQIISVEVMRNGAKEVLLIQL